ncbi:MAG: ribosome biogenesis GTPase Der [Gemmatimonadota bacterium]
MTEGIARLQPLRPVVVILGRPNVGKSTLFNRLVGSRRSITDDRPGVTRDRVYLETEWSGRRFTLVDTGGYVAGSSDAIESAVRQQAELALEEADLVLFLCDAGTGLTGLDREVAELLRRRECPCLLVVNKMDHPNQQRYEGEFYQLGLGDPIPVSAATGRRSGDLLDAVVTRLDALGVAWEVEPGEVIRVAIIGRPNVGKSTLVNRLAGSQVSIVSEQPGTTRDTTGFRLTWQGRRFAIMDTAGLRRRARVEDPVEYYSVLRAGDSIQEADVVLVLVDGVEGLTTQDARIMRQVVDAGRGMVVAVNKWDLADRAGRAAEEFRQQLHDRLPFLGDYPILFVSALTGRRVARCMEGIARVHDNWRRRVSTSRLNQCIEAAGRHLAPSSGGRDLRLLYATQHGVAPPTFVVFCSRPDQVGDSYRRYLENALRKEFGFEGAPLRLHWRSRRSSGTSQRRMTARNQTPGAKS